MNCTLTRRLGALIWYKRSARNIGTCTLAHKAKMTVNRLEQIERGVSFNNIELYYRIARALDTNLWELIKQCEEYKVSMKLIQLQESKKT